VAWESRSLASGSARVGRPDRRRAGPAGGPDRRRPPAAGGPCRSASPAYWYDEDEHESQAKPDQSAGLKEKVGVDFRTVRFGRPELICFFV
jgi:hypothetical protein